jgi:uncharacterized OsmC-like protein
MTKIKATAKWVENVQSIADNTRDHGVVLDLGTASGGTNKGPSALELAIMSLADCAVTIFADVCKKSNVELSKMKVTAEAEKPSDSPIITGVNMKVSIAAKARQQKIDAIWRRTEANCPVLFVFKEKIPINIEVETTSK